MVLTGSPDDTRQLTRVVVGIGDVALGGVEGFATGMLVSTGGGGCVGDELL